MDKILVFDFGSQTTHLIGRRIRSIGVYSEIVPGDANIDSLDLSDVRGIVFSGSPHSVFEDVSPSPDSRVYELELPILGICYGMHRIVHDSGGTVKQGDTRESGRALVRINKRARLFDGVADGFDSWMSHGDSVTKVPSGFTTLAVSENGIPAAVCGVDGRVYGIQFHPEVTHCQFGTAILTNFAVDICGAQAGWDLNAFLAQTEQDLRETIGKKSVLLLISGGVDSSVVAALLLRALEPHQVHLMYVDTGLMREGETQEVLSNLERLGAENTHIVDASERFYRELEGVSDPERKRIIIGDLFITVQEEHVARAGISNSFLAQGTLYPDLIESGMGVGNNARVIKSHHNVRSPLAEAKRNQNLLVEPLSVLYKDEVRELGLLLGLSELVVYRHPFPGPGLAVRVLGPVTKEKCQVLRRADRIFIDELHQRGLYRRIWQAFAVLLPVKSVGVAGDNRRYGHVLALRAVVSEDAMSADVYPFEMNALCEIAARITNEIHEIGRVVYDVSSKPPSTVEWE